MHLWQVEHFFYHLRLPLVLQVPKSDEKSGQMSIRKEVTFLQSHYFSQVIEFPLWVVNIC